MAKEKRLPKQKHFYHHTKDLNGVINRAEDGIGKQQFELENPDKLQVYLDRIATAEVRKHYRKKGRKKMAEERDLHRERIRALADVIHLGFRGHTEDSPDLQAAKTKLQGIEDEMSAINARNREAQKAQAQATAAARIESDRANRPQLEKQLADLKAQHDPHYEYSDDSSHYNKHRLMAGQISDLEDRLSRLQETHDLINTLTTLAAIQPKAPEKGEPKPQPKSVDHGDVQRAIDRLKSGSVNEEKARRFANRAIKLAHSRAMGRTKMTTQPATLEFHPSSVASNVHDNNTHDPTTPPQAGE